jgi:undecaprenyl-diphosphatase
VLTWLQAIVIGLVQGVTELFPISSLGHAVLIPTLFGWDNLARVQSQPESFYLAFIVGLHVGTATGLLILYRRDWVDIVGGVLVSIKDRRITTPVQRLGWLLIVATIPAGLIGVAFEHALRVQFSKPLSAAVFLMVNGVILLGGEILRRRELTRSMNKSASSATKSVKARLAVSDAEAPGSRAIDQVGFPGAFVIGVAQVAALFAGISRSGITMVAGLLRGLSHEDALRFSFLLATPIILAAGVLKLPDLLGPLGNGIRAQVVVGSVAAGVAAYFSARFLTRWFKTRTLWPFGIYCIVVGAAFTVHFAAH